MSGEISKAIIGMVIISALTIAINLFVTDLAINHGVTLSAEENITYSSSNRLTNLTKEFDTIKTNIESDIGSWQGAITIPINIISAGIKLVEIMVYQTKLASEIMFSTSLFMEDSFWIYSLITIIPMVLILL